MNREIKGYFLKEYGSWSVLITAYLIGIAASRTYSPTLVPLFAALALLINSKQPYMTWIRNKRDRTALLVFLSHVATATALLFGIFRGDITMLLPLLIFPVAYLLAGVFAGEHALITELFGFTLISLAAVLAKYLLTGGLDVRLFLGVAFYFTAGVFKVKLLLRKRMRNRIAVVLHILIAAYVYRRMYISYIILLPLIDNLVAAATLYTVKLKTTGWIEVIKGLVFLGLFIRFY